MFNKIVNLVRVVLSVFNPNSKKVQVLKEELEKVQGKYDELKQTHKDIKAKLEGKIDDLTVQAETYRKDIEDIKATAKVVKTTVKPKK